MVPGRFDPVGPGGGGLLGPANGARFPLLGGGGRFKPLATKTMGQQHRKVTKRNRRKKYLKRKADQAKLGGIAKKKSDSAPAKKAAKKTAKKAAKKTVKKAAKKVAKKAAAKKAPAKKAAKKAAKKETEEKPASEE